MADDESIELANRSYDILVDECGASPDARDEFVRVVAEWMDPVTGRTNEYRFQGELGFGGKFWIDRYGAFITRLRVTCYAEDSTRQVEARVDAANKRLDALLMEAHAAVPGG